jgi:N-acetylglucosaminyl-diphospho-decaprenol L-rhamnosyltransferase
MGDDVTLLVSIVNHSNPQLLHDCLRSIRASTHAVDYEIWVVDNATDGTGVKAMREEFPEVRWLFNERRQGFSHNHNQVLTRARATYLCILNDDVIVHEGAFEQLVRFMDENPRVGIAGARLVNVDGSQQDSVFRVPSMLSVLIDACELPRVFARHRRCAIDPSQGNKSADRVGWVLGACMIARRAMIREIGVLDEALFPIAGNEDVDWCLRCARGGWSVGYCHDATLTHFGGQSTRPREGTAVDVMLIEYVCGAIRLFRRHRGFAGEMWFRAVQVLTLPWNLVMMSQALVRGHVTVAQWRRSSATRARVAMLCLAGSGHPK